VLPYFSPSPKVRALKTLYLAEWSTILKLIHEVPDDTQSVLLVGHNPGIERLAVALALNPSGAAERGRAESLAEKFPTAALAVFDFDGKHWTAVKPGLGRLVDFVRPKDLPAGE
jgi:phosphohistidine phosphatase